MLLLLLLLHRLAPLDHIKNLYAGANATISTSKPRRIFHKRVHMISCCFICMMDVVYQHAR